MKSKDFLMREVTVTDEEFDIIVNRTRTSNGFSSITITVGGNRRLEFTSDSELEDNYEQAAMRLSELLDKICANNCLLPKTTEE